MRRARGCCPGLGLPDRAACCDQPTRRLRLPLPDDVVGFCCQSHNLLALKQAMDCGSRTSRVGEESLATLLRLMEWANGASAWHVLLDCFLSCVVERRPSEAASGQRRKRDQSGRWRDKEGRATATVHWLDGVTAANGYRSRARGRGVRRRLAWPVEALSHRSRLVVALSSELARVRIHANVHHIYEQLGRQLANRRPGRLLLQLQVLCALDRPLRAGQKVRACPATQRAMAAAVVGRVLSACAPPRGDPASILSVRRLMDPASLDTPLPDLAGSASAMRTSVHSWMDVTKQCAVRSRAEADLSPLVDGRTDTRFEYRFDAREKDLRLLVQLPARATHVAVYLNAKEDAGGAIREILVWEAASVQVAGEGSGADEQRPEAAGEGASSAAAMDGAGKHPRAGCRLNGARASDRGRTRLLTLRRCRQAAACSSSRGRTWAT